MAKRIFVAVVRDGVIEGDFALVADVDPLGDVDALKQRIKASRSRLRDVELGDMTVFGAWATASEVPEDTTEATKGRRCDPAATLGDLIGGMERAYFLARITAPSSAAAGASVLDWHDAHYMNSRVSPLLPGFMRALTLLD